MYKLNLDLCCVLCSPWCQSMWTYATDKATKRDRGPVSRDSFSMWRRFIMHHCPFSSKVIHCTLPCVKRHWSDLPKGMVGSWSRFLWISMGPSWKSVIGAFVPGVLLHIIHFRYEMDEISRYPTWTWLIGWVWVFTSLQFHIHLYIYITIKCIYIYIYLSHDHTHVFVSTFWILPRTFLGCWYIYISFQKPRKAAVVRALLLLGAWREVKSRRGETPEVKAGGDFLQRGGERPIRKPRNAVIYSYIHETKFRMVSICYLFFIVIGSAAL